MRKIIFHTLSLSLLLVLSCYNAYRSGNVQYTNYSIKNPGTGNPAISSAMKPFADSINKRMDVVIGKNESKLKKKKQGNTLGYFIADAYLFMANRKSAEKVDAAFMNSGGIRLPELPAGDITEGKIYELMPFDNLMFLLKINGSLLKQYLDTLAATEGIIQSGMEIQVKDKEIQQVMIGGKLLEENAEYLVAQSDYVVNTTPMLKNLKIINTAYLMRDAILDYIRNLSSQGKKITVTNIDRILYAE